MAQPLGGADEVDGAVLGPDLATDRDAPMASAPRAQLPFMFPTGCEGPQVEAPFANARMLASPAEKSPTGKNPIGDTSG